MNSTCSHCGREMRTAVQEKAMYPDTIMYGGRGRCSSCKNHLLTHGTLDGWMPKPPRGPGWTAPSAVTHVALYDPRQWEDRALCHQTDPEAFFPDQGISARNAKTVCAKCEVRPECLDYAVENNERHGVWGGLTEHERRPLLRKRTTK